MEDTPDEQADSLQQGGKDDDRQSLDEVDDRIAPELGDQVKNPDDEEQFRGGGGEEEQLTSAFFQ
jgi:hypothetical protein